MVTPLSQFVGSQAAINVIVGERYKEVTDQVIHYALGRWGKEGGSSMEPDVKDKILSRPRAKELARLEPPELSLQEVRRKLGGPGVSDEELLLRWVMMFTRHKNWVSKSIPDFLRISARLQEERNRTKPADAKIRCHLFPRPGRRR